MLTNVFLLMIHIRNNFLYNHLYKISFKLFFFISYVILNIAHIVRHQQVIIFFKYDIHKIIKSTLYILFFKKKYMCIFYYYYKFKICLKRNVMFMRRLILSSLCTKTCVTFLLNYIMRWEWMGTCIKHEAVYRYHHHFHCIM